MTKLNPRYKNGNARRKLRAWLKSQALPCALCGGAIDYTLPAQHPDSFEVDEVVPVSKHWLKRWNAQRQVWAGPYESAEAAALDRDNVQATHRRCNIEKSNKDVLAYHDVTKHQIHRSRAW